MTLVILTEEKSMQATLEHLLPKLGIDLDNVTIIAHQGKSDLEKSIPRKLRGWGDPAARFLILRDNDRGDCRSRKALLANMIGEAGKTNISKVRIVCQELESWFLADRPALVAAGYVQPNKQYGFFNKDPDAIPHPVHEMEKLRPGYGKINGANSIAPHMNPENQNSVSFRNTILAIRELIAA